MQPDRVLFSVPQAIEYKNAQPGLETLLDSVDLVQESDGKAALRLRINHAFVDKKEALETFLAEQYLSVFNDSDTSCKVYIAPDEASITHALETLQRFEYEGMIHVEDEEFFTEDLPTTLSALTYPERTLAAAQAHLHLLHMPVSPFLCNSMELIPDGNAVVGIEGTSNITPISPQAADVSVYTVKFYPKSPDQVDALLRAVSRAAYLTPDYYDSFVRPRDVEFDEEEAEKARMYNSPNGYMQRKQPEFPTIQEWMTTEQTALHRAVMELSVKQNNLKTTADFEAWERDDKENFYNALTKFDEIRRAYNNQRPKLPAFVGPEEEILPRDQYISTHDGAVVLQEITLHDLEVLMQKLSMLGALEPSQQIAQAMHQAVMAEYRSHPKEEVLDTSDFSFGMLIATRRMKVEGQEPKSHEHPETALIATAGNVVKLANVVREFQAAFAHAHPIHKAVDPAWAQQAHHGVMGALLQLVVRASLGDVRLENADGTPVFSTIADFNIATHGPVLRSRLEQMVKTITGIELSNDTESEFATFTKTFYEAKQEEFDQISKVRSTQWLADMASGKTDADLKRKEQEIADRLSGITHEPKRNQANQPTPESATFWYNDSTDWNGHRPVDARTAPIRTGLPMIPFFEKRRELANPTLPTVITSMAPDEAYTPKAVGWLGRPQDANLDRFLPGLNDEYAQSQLEQDANRANTPKALGK